MAEKIPNPPSINPAETGTLSGMLTHAFKKFLQTTDNSLPAVVVFYNRASNRVTVRPLVQLLGTGGERASRAPVQSLPVLQIGAGGAVLHFPLQAGDFGYIHACDRDVSLAMQGKAEAPPNTQRLHSFSDGFFIPAVVDGHAIADEDAEAAVFQLVGAEARLAIHPTHLKTTAQQGHLVADGDALPLDDALFMVDSTLKASRPWPVMTEAQRDAIPTPKSGMAVWIKDGALDYLSTYSEIAGDWS